MWGNKWAAEWLEGLGRITLLARDSVASLLTFKVAWRDLMYQVYFCGVKSQSVVLITGAFTGMVLSAQTYLQFHKVKMDTATLAVVGISMCSELGPVLTGLMVAGRVGAAIAAELGTMRVTEQIDALRTLATHPVDYLVVPRLLALLKTNGFKLITLEEAEADDAYRIEPPLPSRWEGTLIDQWIGAKGLKRPVQALSWLPEIRSPSRFLRKAQQLSVTLPLMWPQTLSRPGP